MDNSRTNKTFIHFMMTAENSCTLGFALVKSVPIPDSVSEAAGKVKTILENDDIPVLKIADNPEKLEKTLIKVRKEGMGNDLLKYFNGATLEASEIEKGFDVIIIVGNLDIDIQQK